MNVWVTICSFGFVLAAAFPARAAVPAHAGNLPHPPPTQAVGKSTTTSLPDVVVQSSPWERRFAGFIVSGNFTVNPNMPYMVYPTTALKHGDVLNIRPLNLLDNEYLVLQVCVTPSCNEAKIVRLWGTNGVLAQTSIDDSQVIIPRKARYFIWLKRLPEITTRATCPVWGDCAHFSSFHLISPPLTLVPNGELTAYYPHELDQAYREPPVKIVSEKHQGSVYIVTFASGSKVRMQRLRPEHSD